MVRMCFGGEAVNVGVEKEGNTAKEKQLVASFDFIASIRNGSSFLQSAVIHEDHFLCLFCDFHLLQVSFSSRGQNRCGLSCGLRLVAKIKWPNASIVAAHEVFLERRNCSLASREPESFGCGFHVRADQAITAALQRLSKRTFSLFKHLQLFQPVISHKPVISPAAACLPRKVESSVNCFVAAEGAAHSLMLAHQRLATLTSRVCSTTSAL